MSKAEYARKWRCRSRQARRENTFISDYLKIKYPAIHAETMKFYQELNTKYRTKDNLTKTAEYRIWKTQQRTTEQAMNNTTTTTAEPEQATNNTATTAEPEQAATISTATEPPESEQATNNITTTAEPEQAATISTAIEPPESEQATNNITTTAEPEQTAMISTATEPPYDFALDPMVLDDLIDEINRDDELRALLNRPFDFELEDDQ